MFLITHPSRLLIPIPRTPVESSEFHRFHGFNTVFEIFRGVLPALPTWQREEPALRFISSFLLCFFSLLLSFRDEYVQKIQGIPRY